MGNLTGITVTNPGTGYTGTPTITLYGGGGTGAAVGTVALNSGNTGGDLTFTNSTATAATTTLSGVNTGFTGNLIINNSSTTVAFGNTAPQTISGLISGAGNLSQTGTGTTTLGSVVNSYTGVTTLTAGTLSVADLENGGVNSGIGASTNVAANLVFNGGALAYSGGTTTIDRLFTLNAATAGTINVTNAATTFILQGATGTVTTGALTKAGPGALTLTGANTYTGNTTVSGGTLNVTGSISGLPASSALNYGGTAGNTIVNLSGSFSGFVTTGANIAGSNSVFNQTGGTVTIVPTNGADLQWVAKVGYGYLNITGGTFNTGRFDVNAPSASAVGVVYVGGSGTLNQNVGDYLIVAYQGLAQLTVGPGGSLTRQAAVTNNFEITMNGTNSSGTLNVAGGTVDAGPAKGLTFGFGSPGTGNTAFVNVAAGSLNLGANTALTGTTGSTNVYFNFAGGTVKANAALPTVIPASTTAFPITSTIFGAIDNSAATSNTSQNFAGGLVFNSNGFNSAFSNVLNGASAFGVTQSSLSVSGGAGYIGAPAVQFLGGTLATNGTPAAGYALISGGAVTGIVITSPGEYTSGNGPSSVTLTGGGFSTAATIAVGTLSANSNTGGLTKLGTGTLTLTGSNTFGGVVDIQAGLLTTTLLANGGSASGIGQSSNAAANVLLDGGVLGYSGTVAGTTDRNFTLAASGGGFDASGTTLGTLTLTSANAITVASSLGAATFVLQGTGTGATGAGSIGSLIADGSGSTVGLTKLGAGTWTIANAANSYTGPTLLSGGTLVRQHTGQRRQQQQHRGLDERRRQPRIQQRHPAVHWNWLHDRPQLHLRQRHDGGRRRHRQ